MDNHNKHIDPVDLLARVLSGEASAREAEQLEDWKNSSPENGAIYEQYLRMWEKSGEITPFTSIDVDSEWENFQSLVGHSGPVQEKPRIINFFVRLAAAIFVGIVVGSSAFFTYRSIRFDKVFAHDMVSEVKLPDGSVVTLNSGTKLVYPKRFRSGARVVSLKGEAFFEVVRDTTAPFAVRSQNIIVEVLGTSFNIDAPVGSNMISVVVEEGSVAVFPKKYREDAEILGSGDKVEYDATSNRLVRQKNDDINYDSWKTGLLIFEDTPIEEVARALSKIYRKEILVEGKELSALHITVSFENRDLDYVLKTIEATLDINVKEINGTLVLSK